MRWLMLAVGLAVTSACSSSDEAAVDAASLDAGADFGLDIGSRRCGFSSCCCKDGRQTSAACAADGTGSCTEGWTYHYDDCPFQSNCRAFDAALPDTPADGDAADCEISEWCCCDLDVVQTPSCSDGRVACAPGYRLLTKAQCATDCLLRLDGGAPD